MQPHNEPTEALGITGTRDAIEAPHGATEGREGASGARVDPVGELWTAAATLRAWVVNEPAAPYGPSAITAFGPELADWLEYTATTAKIGGIHGTSLIICDPCCQQLPCDHLRPALAVARQINGTEATA
jgi:hypothetical protein